MPSFSQPSSPLLAVWVNFNSFLSYSLIHASTSFPLVNKSCVRVFHRVQKILNHSSLHKHSHHTYHGIRERKGIGRMGGGSSPHRLLFSPLFCWVFPRFVHQEGEEVMREKSMCLVPLLGSSFIFFPFVLVLLLFASPCTVDFLDYNIAITTNHCLIQLEHNISYICILELRKCESGCEEI